MAAIAVPQRQLAAHVRGLSVSALAAAAALGGFAVAVPVRVCSRDALGARPEPPRRLPAGIGAGLETCWFDTGLLAAPPRDEERLLVPQLVFIPTNEMELMSSHPVLPVLDHLARVIGATAPGQDTAPTPCADLDVVSLRRHLLGGVGYFAIVLGDPDGDQRPDPRAYSGPDGTGVLVSAIGELSAAVRAALAGGVEAVSVRVPALGGVFPGDYVLSMLVAEAVVHGWDIARATGQDWRPGPAAVERAHALLADQIKPEYRGGAGMPFAPEVPVSPDAPALDRLLGFAGRSPHWTPTPVAKGG